MPRHSGSSIVIFDQRHPEIDGKNSTDASVGGFRGFSSPDDGVGKSRKTWTSFSSVPGRFESPVTTFEALVSRSRIPPPNPSLLNERKQPHTVSPSHLRILIQPTTTETAPPTFKLCIPHQSVLSGATLTITEHMPNVSLNNDTVAEQADSLKIVYDLTLGDKGEQCRVGFDRAQFPPRSNMMTDPGPLEASALVYYSIWDPGVISAVVKTDVSNGLNDKKVYCLHATGVIGQGEDVTAVSDMVMWLAHGETISFVSCPLASQNESRPGQPGSSEERELFVQLTYEPRPFSPLYHANLTRDSRFFFDTRNKISDFLGLKWQKAPCVTQRWCERGDDDDKAEFGCRNVGWSRGAWHQ
ncbi:hypothetical protein BDR22DRAFT_817652 [Usnea florida]